MLNDVANEKDEKLLRLLGLAKRAGKLACGREATLISVRKKRARLIVVARDASERTIEEMEKLAAHHQLPLIGLGDRSSLGRYTGSDLRALVAVEDEGFVRGIMNDVN